MREIKFRVWNTETNKMSTNVKEMGVFALQSIYSIDEFLVIPTNEKYPLMQFTGLKDKNGVEIYEGDILKKGTYSVLVMYSEYHTSFQVYFKEDNPSITSLYEFGYSDEIEVIGNIYENRELLND